jgi:hypothetical protein
VDVRRREPLGHEAPGTVLRGPRITVTFECGEKYARQHSGAATRLLFHGGHYISSGKS